MTDADITDGPLTAEEMQHLTDEEREAYRWAQAVFSFFKKVESRQNADERPPVEPPQALRTKSVG